MTFETILTRETSGHDTSKATSLYNRRLGHDQQVRTSSCPLFIPCTSHKRRSENVGGRKVAVVCTHTQSAHVATRQQTSRRCRMVGTWVAQHANVEQGQQVSQIVDGVSGRECRPAVSESGGCIRGRAGWVSGAVELGTCNMRRGTRADMGRCDDLRKTGRRPKRARGVSRYCSLHAALADAQ